MLIPRNGRPKPGSGGHHNLAWELSGDPRYDPQFGSWREVLAEIAASKMPAVCISSEDLGLLYQKPDALCDLRKQLNSLGYQVRIVIYLRPQADCVESAYAEMARHQVPFSFRQYLEGSIPSDPRKPPGPRAYPFDYRKLLAPFERAFGQEALVVRAYRGSRRPNYLIKDFIATVLPNRKIRGLNYYFSRARHNPSLNFAQVVERTLAQRRLDGSGEFDGDHALVARGEFMRGRFDPLDLRDLRNIRQRLRESNLALRERYEIRLPTVSAGRLLRELMCSAGINRASIKRKALLAELENSAGTSRVTANETA